MHLLQAESKQPLRPRRRRRCSSDGRLSQQTADCRFVDPVAMHELFHDRLGKELIEPRLIQWGMHHIPTLMDSRTAKNLPRQLMCAFILKKLACKNPPEKHCRIYRGSQYVTTLISAITSGVERRVMLRRILPHMLVLGMGAIAACASIPKGNDLQADIASFAYQNVPRFDGRINDDHTMAFSTGTQGGTIASSDIPWRIPVECRRKYRKWLEGESRPAGNQDVWLSRGECDAPPKHAFVGVAITGGGHKSAVYATEVLFELRRYGLLRKVDIISSVSGGSFAALVYGLSCDPDDLACVDPPGWTRPRSQYADMTRLTETNFLWPFVETRFLPNHFLLNVTTHHGSADDMADVVSSRLLHEGNRALTFHDLETQRPNLILNVTNIAQSRVWFDQSSDIPPQYKRPLSDDDALHFAFTQQYFWRLLSNLDLYPLRDALVASAAFPLIIDRPSLRHFRLADLPELRPGGSPPFPDYIALTDGGVHDNFGVTEILWFLRCQFPRPAERSKIEPALYQRECGRPMSRNDTLGPSASLVLGINSSLLRSEGTPKDIPKQRSWDSYALPVRITGASDAVDMTMAASGE